MMMACAVLGASAGCYDYIDVSLCPPVEPSEGEETIPPCTEGTEPDAGAADAAEDAPADAAEDAPTD